MDSVYLGFILSFLLGGISVWIFLRVSFAKTKVPRTEFDQLNAAYRDSIVENVKLEERISTMQKGVEELNEKLLKSEQEILKVNDDKNSLRSMNEILLKKLNAQRAEIEKHPPEI
jgi:SMC interacting uncharacterized protein involved in chromosome segregation